jgi:hypothetical protein
MPLEVHRKQNLLHDILGLIDRLTRACKTAARSGPEHRRNGLEQTLIRGPIPRVGRPHQLGPLLVTSAHAGS